jgi:hypothetical protein
VRSDRAPIVLGMVRLVCALVCLLALAACGGGHSSSSSSSAATVSTTAAAVTSASASTTTSRPSTCAPSQLTLKLVSNQGAAGHLEDQFAFTNSSSSVCRQFGYPGAQMVSSAGGALKTIVIRGGNFFPDSSRKPTTVVLQPGQAARFSFGWSDNNESGGSPATCPRADRLQVTPPNDFSTLTVSVADITFAPCDGKITTSPVFR